MKRVAVIGGGLIGLATAYKLLEKHPGLKLDVYEKEDRPGRHQSGRNSGVLHCGLYYQPGSLKAKLAVEGIREMTAFCQTHGIEHEICGKVVVASNQKQNETLRGLAKTGEANGLTGLKFLSGAELKQREPMVHATETLLVPEEGIVDYKAVMNKLVVLIEELGGVVHFNSPVWQVTETKQHEILVSTATGTQAYDRLVSCTGLHSDRTFSKYTGKKGPLRIVPFRGEYLSFKPEFEHMVNYLVYPVPDVKYPFLGVHFTRMISGEREVGPNAVLAFKREGYSNKDFNLKDTFESLTYVGFLNFLRKNFEFAMGEFASSLLMSSFIAKAKIMIPEVEANMLVKGTAGVRAQAMSAEGTLLMDFNIEREGNQIHVLNAPSPGATSSLAIASYILDNYLTDLNLSKMNTIAKRNIPISLPVTGEEEWQATREPIINGWLTSGPKVREFEQLFAERHNVKHALAVTSATTALHLALVALEIGPGDEVIVPAFTWVSTANVVLYCGANVVFADVDPVTFNIDPEDLKKRITSKTKAIIPVHLFGLCANMDAIKAIAGDIPLVEDGACAAGAAYKGTPAGALGTIGCFSFHPRKSVTTGEGGMITTNDDRIADVLGMLRNHGASISEEQRHHGPRPYILPDFNLLGYNYRMTDLQGAVGVVQIKKLDQFIDERAQWAAWYSEQLAEIPWLRTPQIGANYKHGWQSFVTFVDESKAPCSRNDIMEKLQEQGISTRPGTHAVHMLTYYAMKYNIKPGDYPGAQAANDYSMSIPLHNRMVAEDYHYVVAVLKSL